MKIKEFIEHFTNTLKCYGCNIEELIQQPDMDYNIEVKDTFDSAFNVDIGYSRKIENNFESVSMLVINFSDISNYGVAYNITNWGYIDLYIALINMGYNKLFMKSRHTEVPRYGLHTVGTSAGRLADASALR